MGCYTISIFPNNQYMTTIVTEFVKFRYRRLPMVMCVPGEKFQAKVYNLLSDIEWIKTCIDNILVLIKDRSPNKTYQIRVIFSRMCVTGLKPNAPKWFFWLKDVTYLGYAINWKGIEPVPKKVQMIIDLKRPTTIT